MHTMKANGSVLLILHQRSFEEIHDKPHIARWKGRGDNGQSIRMWAVYYLLGQQSRIRCTLYTELKDAIEQVTYVARMNEKATRFLSHDRR